jgi:hypothetical protein
MEAIPHPDNVGTVRSGVQHGRTLTLIVPFAFGLDKALLRAQQVSNPPGWSVGHPLQSSSQRGMGLLTWGAKKMKKRNSYQNTISFIWTREKPAVSNSCFSRRTSSLEGSDLEHELTYVSLYPLALCQTRCKQQKMHLTTRNSEIR